MYSVCSTRATVAGTDDVGELLRSTKQTWMDEFGRDATYVDGRPGEYFGTAVVRPEMLAGWFSSSECSRLAALGYVVVCIPDARVFRSSENQVLFGRARPLHIGAQLRRWPCIGDESRRSRGGQRRGAI